MESWKIPQLLEQLRELRYSEPRNDKLIAKIEKEINRLESDRVEEGFLASQGRQIPEGYWEGKKEMSADAPEFVYNPPPQPRPRWIKQSDLPNGKGRCRKCGLMK